MQFSDNKEKYELLRKKYPTFYYNNYAYKLTDEGLEIEYNFTCGDIIFNPKQTILKKSFFDFNLEADQIENLIFNIGMIELISYWKATASPNVIVKAASLDNTQIQFWKKLYFHGLGEYFYLNNIETSVEDFMHIRSESDKHFNKTKYNLIDDYIVPIGGGKDSVVTLEMLRSKGKNITPMVINQRGATRDCIKRADFTADATIEIKRTIDLTLLSLNAQGYLNGHTPFSAMLAFNTLLCATLSHKKYIALSNESSANEATDKISGVNHQYSKSLEFENDFRSYYKNYIGEEFEYFSLLRPIKEIRIAQIFSLLDYKDVFKSCNVGSKQDIWCGKCAKCLFAFIILSPFLTPEELKNIFGKNLYADKELLTYFEELTGLKEVKPFECVGTISEVNVAISERIKRFGHNEDDILLNYWLNTPLCREYNMVDAKSFIEEKYAENNLPEDLRNIFSNPFIQVKKAVLAKKLNEENIAVLGLGREGVSTVKLLNEILPHKNFYVFDNDEEKFTLNVNLLANHITYSDREDLEKINQTCSLIFISPGMAPKDFPELDFDKLTNQCDTFLSLFYDQTIGISGTKGKSTTSSLCYEIIKKQYSDTLLAGNIGVPFFDILDEIKAETKIVLELSCHQLQIIKRAPHISVLLNLYEEHLDHYNSFEDYQKAKLNLLIRQTKDDYFIFNNDDERIVRWLKRYDLSRNYLPFSLKDYVFLEPKYLQGNHNKYNILAALLAAKCFGVQIKQAIETAINFKGLAHRMEFIGEKDGVKYYNDSISTIPQATLAALATLKDVSVLILGGMDRGIDYSEITKVVSQYHVPNIAFTGLAGKRMKAIIEDYLNKNNSSYKLNSILTDDWHKIVTFCKQYAIKQSSVLLSPAAASYDKFKNFEHRGNYFTSLVFD